MMGIARMPSNNIMATRRSEHRPLHRDRVLTKPRAGRRLQDVRATAPSSRHALAASFERRSSCAMNAANAFGVRSCSSNLAAIAGV
jgi:hypothetical protein